MSRFSATASLALAAVALSAAPGCQIIGLFQAPKSVEAVYELPEDRRILVLVEDREHAGDFEVLKRLVTQQLNAQLLAHDLAEEVVPYDELMRLRWTTPDWTSVGVSNLGMKLGADLVLYVDIEEFHLREHSNDVLWTGRFKTAVHVTRSGDASSGECRLWPPLSRGKGYPVRIERDPITSFSPTFGQRLQESLAAEMADKIAKLFYEHELTGVDAWSGKASGGGDDIPM